MMGTEVEAGTVGVGILSGGGEVAADHRVQGVQGRGNGERGQVKGSGDVEPEGTQVHGDLVGLEAVDFSGHNQVVHDDFVVSGEGGFLQVEVNHLFGPRYLVFYEREHRSQRGN